MSIRTSNPAHDRLTAAGRVKMAERIMAAAQKKGLRRVREADWKRIFRLIHQGMPEREIVAALPQAQLAMPNPCGGARKANVTDRAHRYRANRCIAGAENVCHACGAGSDLVPHHLDGREENNSPHNLLRVCRSCNVRAGAALRSAGMGRLTRQYNPASATAGATTLAEWVEAVRVVTGQKAGRWPLQKAVEIVHATPADRRSRFAREIWEERRARGTDHRSNPAGRANPGFFSRLLGGQRKEVTLGDLRKMQEDEAHRVACASSDYSAAQRILKQRPVAFARSRGLRIAKSGAAAAGTRRAGRSGYRTREEAAQVALEKARGAVDKKRANPQLAATRRRNLRDERRFSLPGAEDRLLKQLDDIDELIHWIQYDSPKEALRGLPAWRAKRRKIAAKLKLLGLDVPETEENPRRKLKCNPFALPIADELFTLNSAAGVAERMWRGRRNPDDDSPEWRALVAFERERNEKGWSEADFEKWTRLRYAEIDAQLRCGTIDRKKATRLRAFQRQVEKQGKQRLRSRGIRANPRAAAASNHVTPRVIEYGPNWYGVEARSPSGTTHTTSGFYLNLNEAKRAAMEYAGDVAAHAFPPTAAQYITVGPLELVKRNPPRGAVRPSRRNPSDGGAAALYTSFHGRGPSRTGTYDVDTAMPANLAQLGQLLKIQVGGKGRMVTTMHWTPEDGVQLASDPRSQTLYIVGGHQRLAPDHLAHLETEWGAAVLKNQFVLGRIRELTYRTKKEFDRFETIDYYHELGEDTGQRPLLVYDRPNGRLMIVGGAYQVKPEGIVN